MSFLQLRSCSLKNVKPMLLFLIKKEITQNEDIILGSQKKRILNFCFVHEKNLKENKIDKKAKTKEKVC